MQEIYLPIPGHKNNYAISNLGNIKTLPHLIKISNNKGYRVAQEEFHKNKRYFVAFRNKKRCKPLSVAYLVAKLFVPNPHKYKYFDFIDKNKNNCSASNLRWVKNQPISNYMGEKNGNSKLQESEVVQIKQLLIKNIDRYVIANQFNITTMTVSLIATGKSWKHIKIN